MIPPAEETSQPLQYWNFVPENERTEECPEYLLNVSDKDKGILGSWDADFTTIPWEGQNGVKDLVLSNRLDLFQRSPSELRRYRKYMFNINRVHGSIMDFILNNRLHWSKPEMLLTVPSPSSSSISSAASSVSDLSVMLSENPFSNPSNWKILRNDWPYGIDKRVVHLVVWTKFGLTEDPSTGDLTNDMRSKIDNFVGKTFRNVVGAENVVWFKNWKSLKSIPSIEHFHVMIFDPSPNFIEELTGEKDVYVENV